MSIIYRIHKGYWTGESREISDTEGCPEDWTRYTPPSLSSGEYAKFFGGVYEVTADPPPSEPTELEIARNNLKDQVTALRWEIETGGIYLPNGAQVHTTLADQNRITTVVANAQLAGVSEVDFKSASGWVTMSLAEIQGIAALIALHVQACFSAERLHHEAIDLLTLEETADYDITTGWPDVSPPQP